METIGQKPSNTRVTELKPLNNRCQEIISGSNVFNIVSSQIMGLEYGILVLKEVLTSIFIIASGSYNN